MPYRLTQTRGSEGEVEKFALRCTSRTGTTSPKPRINHQLPWTSREVLLDQGLSRAKGGERGRPYGVPFRTM